MLHAFLKNKIPPERFFTLSVLVVNAGNYLYNLLLGRFLGPKAFSDAAILVTFLLVLSFIAMTFQLAVAKFSILLEKKQLEGFTHKMLHICFWISIVLAIGIVVYSQELQQLFHTQTSQMFVFFGIGIPFYFLMSINRGVFQGTNKFYALAFTYQGEMFSRLLFTVLLLYFTSLKPSIGVAIGILISFLFGIFPFTLKKSAFFKKTSWSKATKKKVYAFLLLTAFYELTQIAINNSDILLVKHYYDAHNAGLYASLALIGRVVYFIAWIFVMLLLPKVVEKQKKGQNHVPLLFQYLLYIGVLSTALVLGSALFSELAVTLLFGKAYIAIAPLLWQYALATALFAMANIFAYYFLSLDKYIPVVIAAIFGVLQIAGIMLFHESLKQVVQVQIFVMLGLLLMQLLYFLTVTYFLKKQ